MKNLIYILLVIACMGCKDRAVNESRRLKGTLMKVDSLFNGSYFLGMADDYMFMASYDVDSIIYVAKAKNDSLLSQYSFLSRGQGPDEVNHFYTWIEGSILTVIDYAGSLNKGFRIDCRSRETVQSGKWEKICFSPAAKEVFTSGSSRFTLLNDSAILFLGGRDNYPEFLSVYQLNTGKVFPVGYWPDDGFTGKNHLKQRVYMENAYLFKQKGHDRYLYHAGNGRVVMLFELSDGKMVKQHYIFNAFPQYELRSDGLNYRVKYPDEKSCEALSISTTERYIYMMVSPNIQDKLYKGYPYYYGDKVLVFNWEGDFVTEFDTDVPFCSFVVDDSDGYLYSESLDKGTREDIVIRYKIPDALAH